MNATEHIRIMIPRIAIRWTARTQACSRSGCTAYHEWTGGAGTVTAANLANELYAAGWRVNPADPSKVYCPDHADPNWGPK